MLSASDLANHLACRHLTKLDLAATRGEIEPPRRREALLEALRERGLAHERAFVEHLRGQGLDVLELPQDESSDSAAERTSRAMREGVSVIYQATLAQGRWLGRADVLLRVDRPSGLGGWSYEVVDTKLALETRAGTLLQLCVYSELLGQIQEKLPEHMHVVPPNPAFERESYRLTDFAAYYRSVKGRLDRFVDEGSPSTYPEPVPHCEYCRWWANCEERRRLDDHLSLVAGITKLQRRELVERGIDTLECLAAVPIPLPWRPRRGAADGYVRVREQARVQLEARRSEQPVFELLPPESGRGLARLPQPSDGDVFFDIEGDPFAGEGGMEYLLGWATASEYRSLWSFDREEERSAFSTFVDTMIERWRRFPDLHIYHFAPYEPSALKRLMGRYATRQDEVDRMLRAELFVDLYRAVKEGIRAGVEAYSIKALEVFYGFPRETDLREASAALRAVERAIELQRRDEITPGLKERVESYNRDDCVSARELRDWLESLRDRGLARPAGSKGEPSEAVDERGQRVAALKAALEEGLPADPEDRTREEQARWVLANLLEYYRREMKASWWEYFRLVDLPDEELFWERAGLSSLEYVERIEDGANVPVDRYRFPTQDTDVREGDELRSSDGEPFGHVEDIDVTQRLLDVKKRGDTRDHHPNAVFAFTQVSHDAQSESLIRLGESVAEEGGSETGARRTAKALLVKKAPNPQPLEGEDTLTSACRMARELNGEVLPIQGPPGSGKTYTGARMIADLVRAGKRVGVTALSHKVIRNLLDAVLAADGDVRCLQKVGGKARKDGGVREVSTNSKVDKAFEGGEVDVIGGTAWLWSRDELHEAVDVLFVDEAGQMCLADVLAVSQAGKSLVLLGDPQQLEQPQQGSHPDGTAVSALEYVLDGRKTIAAGQGLFLADTWRLHPTICRFTSEIFYEGRLRSRPDLANQRVEGPTPFAGAGLWYVPVEHEGNQNSSEEEIEEVANIVESLLAKGVVWQNRLQQTRPLTPDDILIVAPYNAQVSDLGERLPGARIGTVDKFQGQEAPVVIYSMATSSPEEAPRGMEFLYSLHRLNVATSRAQAVCILVASPRLLEPECRTPRQMQLANALCRYVELAHKV